ncbi:uncharacterized protein LOC131308354 [Rhododendron vialii]|uniref:uncharacterized protein LOC131308354 n=1 Tax=Rhododendron vialii TaxID=182163 RepID=UPI0026600993|nr:uncharacterized protein LOC131308354 [Rhododendron vialii]
MEEYLKYPIPKKFGSQVGETAAKGYNDASRFRPSVSEQTSANTADPKGKNHAANKGGGKDNRCFKCGETGHMAYLCPKRNLRIGTEQEAEFDQQHNDDNDDSFVVGVLNTDDLEEEEVDNSLISVVRRILTAPKVEKEDRRHTSIFQMLVRCGNQARKLIIDGGSCMNVVSAATVERLKLPVQPHPHLYKVAWIDNTSIPVTQRCLVSFSYGSYSDSIWCDVIPMNGTHILLGRPWLYDRDVQHCGKENTSAFSFKNKEIVLKPMNTTEMEKYKEKNPKDVAENKPITRKCFQAETMELGVIYAVGVKEVSESAAASASVLPSEVAELLSHFSNVAPKELPNELPPLNNVQHAIDLIPGSQLTNLLVYLMNPREHTELKRQVDVFLPDSNITPMGSSIEFSHMNCKQATPNISPQEDEVEKVMELVAGEMKEIIAGPESDTPLQMRKLLPESSSTVPKEFPVELQLVNHEFKQPREVERCTNR